MITTINASADQLAALVKDSPVIVAVGILELTPGASISDSSMEFEVRAKIGYVAKGDIKPNSEIKVKIRLPIKDYLLLNNNPFGMKKGEDYVMFLRPQFAADRETFIHYSFSEIPLGCLAYNLYTWERVKREIKES
ncbi:MAG: hypothetical protein K9M97_09450 [Akkermansiaceae bacterium]|nr:hypothetical protein [Akkermansiaceae bacterium]